MSTLLAIVAIGLPVIALIVVLLGWISYSGMIRYRKYDEAHMRQAAIEAADFDLSLLDASWIVEDVPSPGGYMIRVHAKESDVAQRAHKVALFHHGIGWGWIGMLRYMELFLAEGWTVVAVDSRGHGSSGGGNASYGFYEKADLLAVADWALGSDSSPARFPHEGGFVAYGESMGAGTVLQYAALDPRLDAVIADCPYSSAVGELRARLGAALVPPGVKALVVLVADAFCRRLEGFSLKDVSPETAILETEVPILFVHGLEDGFVPWSMSVAMSESRKRRLPDAITELLLMPGAKHAQSIKADRSRYVEVLRDFLAEALKAKGA
jgi:pimeloyl-ACP methyl ester carboxylesterase